MNLKKTIEFGYVVFFGSKFCEKDSDSKNFSFKVCPLNQTEVKEMIKEVKISRGLLKKEGEKIEEVILKLCKLSKKYPNILDLKIKSLIVNEDISRIVNAKIIWIN